MPGTGREGQTAQPTPRSRDVEFSGEDYRNEGDSEVESGYVPKGRHTGVCKAKNMIMRGVILGCPPQEQDLTV